VRSLELELIVIRSYLTVEPIVSWPTTLILVLRSRFRPTHSLSPKMQQ
jgi:hypothetical protein